jgi:hypothetical protein
LSDYTELRWNVGETTSRQKLNQMVDNTHNLWLKRIEASYKGWGVTRTSGLKIAAGIEGVGPEKVAIMTHQIYFGNFFTPGCRPAVVATTATTRHGYSYTTTRGLAGGEAHATHNGFRVLIALPKGETFLQRVFVNWMAVGY